MRTLAARLGVRASSLYRHFPDRSSIERALAVHAGDQLLERMRFSLQGLKEERALVAASRVYVEFAISEAAFYDLLMQSAGLRPQSSDSAKQIWEFFRQLVGETTNMGGEEAGAAALWSFLHGFTVLLRAGQITEASSRSAFTRGINAMIRGLSIPEADSASSAS